jgi:PBP1b-binding outer membrane lipoprotein LpoB
MKKTIATLFLAAVVLTGCQETPEEAAYHKAGYEAVCTGYSTSIMLMPMYLDGKNMTLMPVPITSCDGYQWQCQRPVCAKVEVDL